jgi:hypothetical protein
MTQGGRGLGWGVDFLLEFVSAATINTAVFGDHKRERRRWHRDREKKKKFNYAMIPGMKQFKISWAPPSLGV